MVRALYALKRAGELEAAIALAEQEMPNWPQSPDFFFALDDLLREWAIQHPQQAAQEIRPVQLEGIDTVVHTAALKQVPAAKYNPFECIKIKRPLCLDAEGEGVYRLDYAHL